MPPINDFSSGQFSLKWNNFSNNLSIGFSSHLNTKDLVDVTLAVEGQLIQAHKLILSICSSYFQDIFKNNPCQHPVVILKDMKYADIDALLKFMYQGEVNVKQEELASFLKVAETLKVKGLTLEDNADEIVSKHTDFSELSQSYFDESFAQSECLESIKQDENSLNKKRSRDCTNTKSSKKTKKSLAALDNESLPKITLKTEVDEDNDLSKENSVEYEENLIDTCFLNKNVEQGNIDPTEMEEVPGNNDVVSTDELNESIEHQPTITYRLSTRGRPQLVHNGYVYNLTSRSQILNRSHYRCAKQHRGCRGKCAVIAEQFMPTGVHDHNHTPGYPVENAYKNRKSTDTI